MRPADDPEARPGGLSWQAWTVQCGLWRAEEGATWPHCREWTTASATESPARRLELLTVQAPSPGGRGTISRHVWLAGYRGLFGATPPTGSGAIVAPTLLLHGADDELVDLAQAVELAATIAGSRLVTYERTGHFVHWERPDWLARDLAGFVTAGGPA